MTGPLKAYQDLIDQGVIDPDPAQADAIAQLDHLAHRLQGYDPADRGGWLRKAPPRPRGLYLWGNVGVGKSLLMDLFFETAPITAKRRVHFHAFMQEMHGFIADWRGMDDRARRRHPARDKGASLDDPIPHAAHSVFAEAHLLCFDEFQVTDITDAMLLGRLFTELFARGAVVVSTSNRVPGDLYKDGINRELFLPFIDLLTRQVDVLELKGAKDYRLDRLRETSVYFTPLNRQADADMDALWATLTAKAPAARAEIKSGSRRVVVPEAARGCARGEFEHWCGQPLGPKDYLLLAGSYPVVFIDAIPVMGPHNRDKAKRFVTLVDALYEARCTLICSAEARPDDLYPDGDGSFEFQRTISRLHEMQSVAYLEANHQGVSLERAA